MAEKTPEQMTRDEVAETVGLEGIEDKKQRDVIAQELYERRKDLLSEKASSRRGLLTEKIAEIGRTQKDTNQLLDQIIAELQRSRIEEDIFGDFEVANHGIDGKADSMFKGGYAGWYHDRMVAYGISASMDTKDYALNTYVLPALRNVPPLAKREYRNLYAVQAIDAYVKAMDAFEGPSDLTKEEVRQNLHMQTFQEWVQANPQLPKEDLYLKYDKVDQAALAASEGLLTSIAEKLADPSIPEDIKKSFQARYEAIKSTQTEDPKKARENAQSLLQEIEAQIASVGAAAGLSSTILSIEQQLQSTNIPAEQKEQYNQRLEAIRQKQEQDPTNAKAEADALLSEISGVSSAPAATPGETAETGVNFLDDPIGYLKTEHPQLYTVVATLGLQGMVIGLVSWVKGYGSKIGDQIEGLWGDWSLSKVMKKGKKMLKDVFDFGAGEAGKLLSLKVGDVLKAGAPPAEAGIDKDKFAALQESLRLNGAEDDSDEALGDFLGNRADDWKKAEDQQTQPPTTPPEGPSENVA